MKYETNIKSHFLPSSLNTLYFVDLLSKQKVLVLAHDVSAVRSELSKTNNTNNENV